MPRMCFAAGARSPRLFMAWAVMGIARRTVTIGAAAGLAVLSFIGGVYFAVNSGKAPKLEGGIANAVESLVERDSELARRTIARDAEVNRMDVDTDALCIRLLALRQPVCVLPG